MDALNRKQCSVDDNVAEVVPLLSDSKLENKFKGNLKK